MYMCPYARFQSAMFDQDTLVIAYDEQRGEPRGSRKRGTDPQQAGLGACIDCTLCEQVCPTGIDIRNGLQYQCIGCAACIDVCDQVMDKMGYEKNLIRYTTENALNGKRTRILRPRIILYAVILSLLSIALIYAISQRVPMEMDIIRDRNALYRETPDGLIENVYTVKLINMSTETRTVTLSVTGIPDAELVNAGTAIPLAGEEVRSIPVSVRVDPVNLKRPASEIQFTVSDTNSPLTRTEPARFLGPVSGR